MSDIYFTSDTHYMHKNIVRGTSTWESARNQRDFDTPEEMSAELVKRINDKVPADAQLFHLGDWSFGGFDNIRKFREQINCKNITIILGNHDHHIKKNKENIQSLFTSVHNYYELCIGEHMFVMSHYPMLDWNNRPRPSYMLHGHVHSSPETKRNGMRLDVGCEGNALTPYSLDELLLTFR